MPDLSYAIETLEIERAKHRAVERELHRQLNEYPCQPGKDTEQEEHEIVAQFDRAIAYLKVAQETF